MENQSWLGRLFNRTPEQQATPQRPAPQHSVPQPPPTEQGTHTPIPPLAAQVALPGSPAPPVSTPSAGEAEAGVPAIWQIGDVILDQYEVTGHLGQGGMGTVQKIHHRGWNIDLAVKSPRPEIFAKTGGKENFIREAETWVNLGLHPHLVSCYYVRTLGGIPRVFAEYIAGGSLAEWIRNRRLYAGGQKPALERICDIAIQFAWGLHYAHEQGLIHQDVKPANVMMTPDGIAKVTDFGLAKARALAGEQSGDGGNGQQSILVSSRGMTPAYCSPEQATRQPLSRKTDLWSWGVSVLEMFVGGVTWMVGAIAREALASHEAQDPAIPLMPAEMVKLLGRCFQPRPEDRPATLLEVAADLQAIYARLVGHSYPREGPRPADLLADSLNNRALSLYDLGKGEEARQVWERALEADPQHLETTYNRGIVLWRRGELTDDLLVQQLEKVRTTHTGRWQAAYLLAQVQGERGEMDAAYALLTEAIQLAPEEKDVQILLERARSGRTSSGQYVRILQGHTGWVTAVRLSADGRLALSGSSDTTVRVWEVSTGQCLRTFQGHTAEVSAVSLSGDGRLALSGSRDGTARVWEVHTGRSLHILRGHTKGVNAVSLSADGRLALSGSEDTTVRLWEVSTGQCLRTLQDHTAEVSSVSLSTDGRFALSGNDAGIESNDHTMRLWEMSTGRCLQVFQGHTEKVSSVSLSTDGRFALSGSFDQTVRLWEVSTGHCLRIFRGHTGGVSSVSLSTNGRFALSGSSSTDKKTRLWEISTGQCLHTFQGNTDPWVAAVRSVSLSGDGRLALAGSHDQTVKVWELPRERSFCPLHLSRLRSYADLSHGEVQAGVLLQQGEDAYQAARFAQALNLLRKLRALPEWERTPKSLEAWSKLALRSSRVGLRAHWLARTLQGHTKRVNAVSLSADGRLALSGSDDGSVRLWEVSTGHCLRTFESNSGMVLAVSLSGDGRLALSGGADEIVRLWEVESSRCLHVLNHTSWVTSVSLSADGRLGIAGSQYNSVRVWEMDTGRCLLDLQCHWRSVSLSADNRFALSGSKDGTMRLWEVSTGRCLRTFQGHTKEVEFVSLSADGRFALSSAGGEKTIRLWEVSTGRCLRTFPSDMGQVSSASLSTDKLLALSQSDKTIGIWKVSSEHCLRTFQGHTGWINSASLSTDGRWVLSSSDDRTARLWDVSSGHCLGIFQSHTGTGNILSVSLSADGRWFLLLGMHETAVQVWELDWELEAHDQADWDEGASSHLEAFLAQHIPYAGTLPAEREPSEEEIRRALTRRGKAIWTEEDFQGLIRQLQYAGYGWLRPEGVRGKLEELAASWQEPPPFTSAQNTSDQQTQGTSVQRTNKPTSIGMAWMEDDGTIVLFLRAEEGDIIGHAHLDYPPNHPEYAEVLNHLGGLTPGERKSVKPWPETL